MANDADPKDGKPDAILSLSKDAQLTCVILSGKLAERQAGAKNLAVLPLTACH